MAIHIEDLHFAYDGNLILNNIHLDIPEGKFSVLLGKNGSGKSTLLKIIAGFLKFKQGQIKIMGQDAKSLDSLKRAKMVGFLPQQHHAVFPFLAEDVVITGRARFVSFTPSEKDRCLALDAMEKIGILHLKSRPFTELSGGEQQLVMIARVLAQNPKIILLDEPTSHLDFVNSHRLLTLARQLVEIGYTVLAVLHDPNQAFFCGDEFIFLKDREIYTPPDDAPPWSEAVLNTVYDTRVTIVPFNDRALVVPQKHPAN